MAETWKLAEAARKYGPVSSLVLTLGAAAILSGTGRGTVRVSGLAESQTWSAASLEMGRIATLSIEVGEEVTQGQVIASLDTTALDAEIAIAEAQKTRLQAILPAKEAAAGEKLAEEIASMERELLDDEAALAKAKSEMTVIEIERARVQKSIEGNLATRDQLTQLDARLAATKPILEQTPRQIDLVKKQLTSARARLKDLEGAQAAGGTTSASGDLLVMAARIEKLKRQRAEMTVRAPSAGRIAAVLHRVGEVVPAGQPIVTMVSARPRVIACVTRDHALDLAVGQRAILHAHGDHSSDQKLIGHAVALGAAVEELPLACRKYPTRPAWGRTVTIQLDAPVALVPNQPFEVEIDLRSVKPGAPVPAAMTGTSITSGLSSALIPAASASSLPSEAPPAQMIVPDDLRKKTRFEPSGILWRAASKRYLVVSDDTGQKDDHDRAPWLFAMDEKGAVAPEPIVIAGLSEIDDLESITEGASGEIYVLSSQSHSRHGKRPTSRTLLARLTEQGSDIRADADLHLADVIESSPESRAALFDRKGAEQELEIEGMTFHEGALYLGLKGPVDDQGRVAIWKIEDPAALFRTRSLDAAKTSVWARVQLDADVDGKSVPGGISELIFAPDGSLVITSTSSRAEGTIESGRLWAVASPKAGVLTPRLVRTFEGKKPEGLSAAAQTGRLIVVFDAGSEAPSWLTLPWPATPSP